MENGGGGYMKKEKKVKDTSVSVQNVYRLEGRVPVSRAIPFGLQHVLAMFVANVAPLIIIASVAVYDGQPFSAVGAAISGLEGRIGTADRNGPFIHLPGSSNVGRFKGLWHNGGSHHSRRCFRRHTRPYSKILEKDHLAVAFVMRCSCDRTQHP